LLAVVLAGDASVNALDWLWGHSCDGGATGLNGDSSRRYGKSVRTAAEWGCMQAEFFFRRSASPDGRNYRR
jgi:hypothetical protein